MPRRERPAETTRSEHWLRFVVNERTQQLNSVVAEVFGWSRHDDVRWLSPIKDDDFAEYYDQEFLDRLGLSKLRVPLREFWPRGGPAMGWTRKDRERQGYPHRSEGVYRRNGRLP